MLSKPPETGNTLKLSVASWAWKKRWSFLWPPEMEKTLKLPFASRDWKNNETPVASWDWKKIKLLWYVKNIQFLPEARKHWNFLLPPETGKALKLPVASNIENIETSSCLQILEKHWNFLLPPETGKTLKLPVTSGDWKKLKLLVASWDRKILKLLAVSWDWNILKTSCCLQRPEKHWNFSGM